MSDIIYPDALPGLVDDSPEEDGKDAEAEDEERQSWKVMFKVHQGHKYHHHQAWN